MTKRENWRKIDTAPKDGTRIRLRRLFDGTRIEGFGYFGSVTIGYADKPQTFSDVWADEDRQHFFPTPTHWMPVEPSDG